MLFQADLRLSSADDAFGYFKKNLFFLLMFYVGWRE